MYKYNESVEIWEYIVLQFGKNLNENLGKASR